MFTMAPLTPRLIIFLATTYEMSSGAVDAHHPLEMRNINIQESTRNNDSGIVDQVVYIARFLSCLDGFLWLR